MNWRRLLISIIKTSGWTQARLSRYLKTNESTVSLWVSGRRCCPLHDDLGIFLKRLYPVEEDRNKALVFVYYGGETPETEHHKEQREKIEKEIKKRVKIRA